MESNHSTHTPRAQRSGLVSIWRDVTARDVERHLVAVKCHSGQSQQSISHRSPMIYDAGLIVLQPRCRQNVTRWIFFVCVCICLPACTSGVLKHHQGAVRKMHLNAGWGTSNKTGKKCDAKAFLGSNAGAKKNILPTRLCSFSNTIHRRKRHKDPDTRCCSDSPLLSKWVTGCIMSLAGVFWPG